jgi:hypothetical protein
MKITSKTIWEVDGKQFDDEVLAQEHVNKALMVKETMFEKYQRTYGGVELLKKHSLDEVGLWEICGEDPNCDFGGHHHQPYIDTVHGKLKDAIEFGVTHKDFWQWGGGGRIRKIEVRQV